MGEFSHQELLSILKESVLVATGCTEPVAVAYSVASASVGISLDSIKSIEIYVDLGIYKNGKNVGIPGIPDRGLDIAAALGLIIRNPEKKLSILGNITEEQLQEAKKILDKKNIKIHTRDNIDRLYIETVIKTDKETVRLLTLDNHLNARRIERDDELKSIGLTESKVNSAKIIQKYGFDDFFSFANDIGIEEIEFLNIGVAMNKKIAEEGLKIEKGIGSELRKMIVEGILDDNVINRAQILCSAASEARMSGSTLPVMSTAGSGNHGITVFLTNAAVAEKENVDKEKLLRALALSNLLTIYIKSYTGTLSPICGCGVAAGIGASAGSVLLLGGEKEAMYGAMLNMVGTLTGIICDGGKEGCAFKLALSAGWAVQSALLAIRGVSINPENGILSEDFDKLFKNLGDISMLGMKDANKVIVQAL